MTTYKYTGSTGLAGFPQFHLLTSITRKITDGTSVITTMDYDTANRFVPKSTTVDSGAGKLNLATTFTYDAVGNLAKVDGPRPDKDGDVTACGYDAQRRQTSIVNALNEQPLGSVQHLLLTQDWPEA